VHVYQKREEAGTHRGEMLRDEEKVHETFPFNNKHHVERLLVPRSLHCRSVVQESPPPGKVQLISGQCVCVCVRACVQRLARAVAQRVCCIVGQQPPPTHTASSSG